MVTLKDKNGWPASLRESVANSDGDRYYLDDGALDMFDSHMVRMVRNTGSRFVTIERLTNYLGGANYRGVQFMFRWDSLGRNQHVTVTRTDLYPTVQEVEDVIDRGYFED